MAIDCLDFKSGKDFAIYQGDCVKVLSQMPDACIDFAIYSPPFSNLFVYSNDPADMGNAVDDDEFFQHYDYLLQQLTRLIKPGRLVAVHCCDLYYRKWKDGLMGIKPFSDMLTAAHRAQGHILHSRVIVWKSPVVEQQRTKALGLLYKQLRKDSSMSRVGTPDYVMVYRMPGENAEPITHTPSDFPLEQWQEWASPVWMTIEQGNTLNKEMAREQNDERHIAPLQLDLIERCVRLWSNPGDTVLSPFAGIGSEGRVSLQHGRKFIGVELKESYFQQAFKYISSAIRKTVGFFD